MNTINHALWGATIGRVVGLPVEGAVIASVPDIISVPFFGLAKYGYKVSNYSPFSKIASIVALTLFNLIA